MQIDNPAELLPKVIKSLKTVSDAEMQGRLFTALVALLDGKEMIEMVEKLIEEDDLLMDTPYLRRIREEGRQEGRQEGWLTAFRQNILDALVLRFDPPVSIYQQLEKRLERISDEAQLETLFAAAIQAESLDAFKALLNDH